MAFVKCTYNITGAVPFNPRKFPMLIEVRGGIEAKEVLCKTPDDIPQQTDFVVLGTCIATITQKETD